MRVYSGISYGVSLVLVDKIRELIFGTEFGTDVCTDRIEPLYLFCDVVFVTPVLNLWIRKINHLSICPRRSDHTAPTELVSCLAGNQLRHGTQCGAGRCSVSSPQSRELGLQKLWLRGHGPGVNLSPARFSPISD